MYTVESRLVRLRYRDRYVYLKSDSERYGTMTQYADGMIEFDFSGCTILRVEPVPLTPEYLAAQMGVSTEALAVSESNTRELAETHTRIIGDSLR